MKIPSLTERQVRILKAVVEEYIQTGGPIGSETLDKKYNLGVSPATIRNEMVVLSKQGFLTKPFPSAGRVPNSLALKYYVQQLMEEKELSVAEEVAVKEKIWDYRFEKDKLLQQSAQALAQHTENIAVIVTDDGEVFIIPPVMGLSNTLLNKSHHRVYFEGTPEYKGKTLRRHGDRMQRLPNGYYQARGRVDDAMNLGGIKVSAIQLEQVINSLEYIKESAAVAVTPPKGGPDMLVVYYVLQSDMDKKIVSKEISRIIRTQINPLFRVQQAVAIDKLPRTASGKLMRRMLRKRYLESI